MKASITSKRFEKPDERRDFKGHGHMDLLELSPELSIGRGIFEPGWKWSNDVKPLVETKTCEVEHAGYCIEGNMTVRMNDGKELKIKAGDSFHIPPGHDAWVDGNENCVLLDFVGFKEYAKKVGERAA